MSYTDNLQELIPTLRSAKVRKSSKLVGDQVLPAADGGYFVSPKVFEHIQSLTHESNRAAEGLNRSPV